MVRTVTLEDHDAIVAWFAAHGKATTWDELPPRGLIVPDVAAGFLVGTDARVAFLDAYVTNPAAPAAARDAALDAITDGLIERARVAGYRDLLAFTAIDGIADRACRHGFTRFGRMHGLIQEL